MEAIITRHHRWMQSFERSGAPDYCRNPNQPVTGSRRVGRPWGKSCVRSPQFGGRFKGEPTGSQLHSRCAVLAGMSGGGLVNGLVINVQSSRSQCSGVGRQQGTSAVSVGVGSHCHIITAQARSLLSCVDSVVVQLAPGGCCLLVPDLWDDLSCVQSERNTVNGVCRTPSASVSGAPQSPAGHCVLQSSQLVVQAAPPSRSQSHSHGGKQHGGSSSALLLPLGMALRARGRGSACNKLRCCAKRSAPIRIVERGGTWGGQILGIVDRFLGLEEGR